MEKKGKKPSINTMFMIIFILFILMLEAVGGIIMYSAHVKEKHCSAAAEGVLLEWGKRRSANKVKYYPIVQYQVGDKAYTGVSNAETIKRPFKEGDMITICYNPADPFVFYIKGYDLKLIRSLGSIFLIMGLVLALVHMICAVLNRMDMEENKRVRIKEIFYALGVLFVFYWIVILISGIGMAVFLTIIITPFIIYVKYKNRETHQKDSAS